MKRLAAPTFCLLTLGLAWLGLGSSQAGQFKRVSLDGNFDDWLGVPVAAVDDAGDANGALDIRDVAVANDDEFLYVRLRLHAPANYANFNHQLIVDTDDDPGTGHSWGGIGSELFIENGQSYQQTNGAFNEGAGSDLQWAVSPSGESAQFEMRISRNVLDAGGEPFFGPDDVVLSVMVRSLEWELSDSVEQVPYRFAERPQPFEGTASLTDFTDTFWFYQEVKDPEPDWLLPDYLGDDTWKGDHGFFSFGDVAEDYPTETAVALTPGRVTYYFRTPFLWEHAAEGVALLADLLITDGAVIYLNGDEVRRVRMPEGAIDGSTHALAEPAAPGEVERVSLPASALIVGENLLMVEVHQTADTMDSLAFGLSLTANDSVPPTLEDPDKPADREVVEGESTVFTLGPIAGTEPYSFQWFHNGKPLPEATTARLEIPVVLVDHAGVYQAEVSNASGSVPSREATLTTTAVPVAFEDDALPADTTVKEGEAINLTVSVTGSPVIAYQWYKGDKPIEGAIGPSLAIEEASLEATGEYYVTVRNRLNNLTSRTARVTVSSDAEAPCIAGITGASGRVEIRFSEPLEASSAEEAGHYTIDGGAVAVNGAVLADDRQTVTLETGSMAFGTEHSLAVSGVEDRFGNRTELAVSFRSTILIDGDFSDWEGIEVLRTELADEGGGGFDSFWAANDDTYLYLRFSFHEAVELPVTSYYQIFIDGDNDPGTGLSVSTIGSSLMIENGNGWLQQGGEFNEGAVATEFAIAPPGSSTQFECRIALDSSREGTPIFTAGSVGVTFNLVSTGWEVVDSGPAEAIVHALQEWEAPVDPGDPPVTLPALTIGLTAEGRLRLEWTEGSLETSETLLPGSWEPVGGAESPHDVDLSAAGARFYRSRD